jgi:hypothetical protein
VGARSTFSAVISGTPRDTVSLLVWCFAMGLAGCSGPAFDDPVADYTQRTMLVSTTGGNAQAANFVIQTDTPWPHYSTNTNIPGDGARLVKAVQRYESGASSDAGSQTSANGGASGMAGMSGGAVAPAPTGMTGSSSSAPQPQ